MSCVHYKFSSKLTYDTITFDGIHISLCYLKKKIMGREKLKAANSDLQITNAETKEEYTDDNALIPKNSSVIVRRIPGRGVKSTSKTYALGRTKTMMAPAKAIDVTSAPISLAQLTKTPNLTEAHASEEDKIKAMMLQSVHAFDPDNSMKTTLVVQPPPSYTCLRCGKPGHYIKDCPTISDKNLESRRRIIKCTGIPRSFLMEVKDPTMKGAMLTNTGNYVILTIDAEAYAIGKKEKPPFLPEQPSSPTEQGDPIPEELLCRICKEIMTDAALIPCCGNSYCDECVRTALLESDEHTCPTCQQNDVSPDALVANKVLRQAVNNFQNGLGYPTKLRKCLSPTTPPIPPPRPLNQQNLQPRMRFPISRQQDSLIPVTSSSAHPTPPISSLISNPSSLAPSVLENPSSAPAPVPDITATVSTSVHAENSDGPSLDSDNKSLLAAALTSEPSKGASSTASMEEKINQVPVLSTGPVKLNAGSGLVRPGWEHSNKLGYLVSPPQQIRSGERSFYRSINSRQHHGERSQRTNCPSLPATPGFLPVPPAPLFLPPLLPQGETHPQFSLQFPPGQTPPAGYSVPPPGFSPFPATTTGKQTPHSNAIPTKQHATPLSREEFYKEQGRTKEESKFPHSWSSYENSSYTYSKSRSGSTVSRSCSRPFRCSLSSSYSRSPPYPRRRRVDRSKYCSRSTTHGYHRSRSRSPLYSRCHSESRSPEAFRGKSPTKSKVPQEETEHESLNRYRDVTPPYDIKDYCWQGFNFRDPFEKERYQEWERKYHEWHEKYQKVCSVCAA